MTQSDDLIIGIDLGTTFSMVACMDDRGPRVIRDESGDARVPSVLRFAPDGGVTIGWEARNSAVEHPRDTVYSVKRLMGLGVEQLAAELPFLSYRVGPRPNLDDASQRDVAAVEINGRWLTPQEISARLLSYLRCRAEDHLGRRVRKAVITVPAYFDDSQRQATRDAARIAGLDVVRFVNEPTAAALAYGLGAHGGASRAGDDATAQTVGPRHGTALPIGDQSKCTGAGATDSSGLSPTDAQTIAVYDLGGGTFDVSILRVEDGVFEVLGTHGDTRLGGDDFDRAIIQLVQREVKANLGIDIDAPQTQQALRLFAEQVKIRLSSDDRAAIELDLGAGRTYRRELTRDEFESLIADRIDATIDSCKQALRAAQVSAADLDRVILVGGSSRIPLVRRRIQECFGAEPYTALNPDEVVALGAAVQARILMGGRRDLLLLDVTPLSLGIETMGGAMGKLIMANTRVPCQVTEMFTTFAEGQTNVKINVLQGERELVKDCRSLGEFELRGIPPMPAGIPKIAVTFLIDANGILSVSAREERSGVQAGIQVIPAHGLTADEVQQAAREATAHARDDMRAHRLIDLRNQVEFDTAKVQQALDAVGDDLPDHERARIERDMAALREFASRAGDADALHQALDAFDKSTLRLAELNIAAGLRAIRQN